jgi:hypothetical protein
MAEAILSNITEPPQDYDWAARAGFCPAAHTLCLAIRRDDEQTEFDRIGAMRPAAMRV